MLLSVCGQQQRISPSSTETLLNRIDTAGFPDRTEHIEWLLKIGIANPISVEFVFFWQLSCLKWSCFDRELRFDMLPSACAFLLFVHGSSGR